MPDLQDLILPRRGGSADPDAGALPGTARTSRAPAREAVPETSGSVDVSVCIVNWNCRDLLRACIQSLLDQPSGPRLEIVVVDNGSKDGAAEMVRCEFPSVVLQPNPGNFGFATGNNQAAARSHGRYLFFLNNDTVVPPGALGELVEYADEHPEVGMIGPRLCDGQGRTQVSYRQRPTMGTLLHRTSLLRWTGLFRKAYRRYRRKDFDPNKTRQVEVLMGAALLIPREVFFASGQWDDGYRFGGEDLDLSFQVSRRFPIIYFPQVQITHYGRVSTRQHIGFASSEMTAGFARYLRNTGCSRSALWAYKAVVLIDAPLQLAGKALQFGWRRLNCRRDDAEKSWLAFQGMWHFIRRGFVSFLKA